MLLTISVPIAAQTTIPPFVINGSATQISPLCYRLTPEQAAQAGSIWSEQQIDLNLSFEAEALLYLGCANPTPCFEDSDDGADGIVFAFQPISTSVGVSGGGIGISGVAPSLCIEIDTYPNGGFGDPPYDHLRIFANGDPDANTANSLTTSVAAIDATTNIEDCNEHTLNVRWDAATQTMTVYFDCELKLSYTGDIINDIFGGDPNVFWGFTSATGACTSEQRVCISIPPTFQTNDTTICAGESIALQAPDNATSYLWTPSNGLSDPNIANPIATPNQTTTYNVALTNECNFVTNFEVTITVNPVPVWEQDAQICNGEFFIVGSSIYVESGTYTTTFGLPTGCDSIVITHLSVVDNVTNSIADTICLGNTYTLPSGQAVSTAGTYIDTLSTISGCDSIITVILTVNTPNCDDNNCNTTDSYDPNTCNCLNTPIEAPNCDDNNCNTADSYDPNTCNCLNMPIETPNCDDNNCNTTDNYDPNTCNCLNTPIEAPNCDDGNANTLDSYVTATCSCQHSPITLHTVLVPSAFTPNGDGINDELIPIGTPIVNMQFRIFNRWGQMVFESTEIGKGWTGKFKDTDQETGVYIYTLTYSNTDNPAESISQRGNVSLLR
ncbi:MAG: gliding motility-associated C-terminal domain-containing protein [Chitinophagales bacterium]|nr:gliding motility-associated C-terminal domain-containing protein [Chitinophagales bacterium]